MSTEKNLDSSISTSLLVSVSQWQHVILFAKEAQTCIYSLLQQFSQDIATTLGGRSGNNIITCFHESGGCTYSEGEHGHILFYNYRGSAVAQRIKWLVDEFNLGVTKSWCFSPTGLREYLHSGGGRFVLYEKAVDKAVFREADARLCTIHAPGRGEISGEENNTNQPSSATESSVGGRDTSNTKRNMDEQLEPHPSSSKRAKTCRADILANMVKKYQSESTLELIESILAKGTEFEKDYIVKSNKSNSFQIQLDHNIFCNQLANKFTDWFSLIDSLNIGLKDNRRSYATIEDSVLWFEKIMMHNNIDIKFFLQTVYDVLNRKYMKRNTIWLHGEPNCGKSLIANSIGDSCIYPFRAEQPDPKEARFIYTGLADSAAGRWVGFHRELLDHVQGLVDQALIAVYVDGEEPRIIL